jgi:hypothetical protein
VCPDETDNGQIISEAIRQNEVLSFSYQVIQLSVAAWKQLHMISRCTARLFHVELTRVGTAKNASWGCRGRLPVLGLAM